MALSTDHFARWARESLRAVLTLVRLERDGQAFEPTALRERATLRVPVSEEHSTADAVWLGKPTSRRSPLSPRSRCSRRPSPALGRGHSRRPGLQKSASPPEQIGGIPPSLAAREEPEIHLAWLTLRSILEHFELLVGGVAVEPTGFTLRRSEDWTFEQDSPAAMLAALARPCPYRCEFCYEEGLPDASRPQVRGLVPEAELNARMALWRKGRDLAGFQGLRYGEILPHPRFAEALQTVRQVADRPIPIATAGAGLNEEKLRALAGRPRVLVQLSLNTCDPARRERLMGDRQAARLMQLLPRFRELDIAWAASAVAWPGLPLEDLAATIRAAQEHGALHFVVFLPSFSKYFPLEPVFDWKARWRETTAFVRELRAKVRIPVRIAPDSWEAAEGFANPLAIEVIGVTPGSAADRRLCAGDRVIAVDGAPELLSRPAANRALERAWREARDFTVRVERGDRAVEVRLSANDASPGYPGELDAPFGVHIYDGPDELNLARGVELLRFSGARRGWVLSAQLMAKPYELLWGCVQGANAWRGGAQNPQSAIANPQSNSPSPRTRIRSSRPSLASGGGQSPGCAVHDAAALELDFIPVENAFWGGNILVGDLLTADDFVRAVRAKLAAGATPPDALLVPFSPFHPAYWRDLTGASFLEIERRTGLPAFPLISGSQP